MPLRLGNLVLNDLVIQSPLAGFSDLAFRLIGREKGMEFAFLEMVSANALVLKNKRTLDYLKTVPEDRPLGAQLVGCEPEIMGEAAAAIEDMRFDLLDLNLGCPVRKVTALGAGAALLTEPAKAEAVFKSVMKSVKNIPVTVKMRKGYADESGDEAVEMAKIAEACGISAVAIHGRTRAAGYSSRSDPGVIARAKAAVKIPVIGNGDVMSGPDAVRLREQTGCDAVMLGRGGMGNPWIYAEVARALRGEDGRSAPPGADEIRETLLRHFDLKLRHQAERVAVLEMRQIAGQYAKGLPDAAGFRSRMHGVSGVAEARRVIQEFFRS
ncbi:MAG: tRNA dihydrouridine synthase DusB [Elusimicrobia bacterium RIFCSPLOWO2_12_FULL_59_9]|nr:MAG: tRNA dihydrouridine synthase DusB [Elusimicrobia bacterium RIFCSPLOWO2_12_FULL_59_9]